MRNLERLGRHAKFIRGLTFKPDQKCEPGSPDSIVCMRTKNVQAELDQSDLIAVPRSLVKKDEKIIRDGDMLVSSANSWNLVGKCCYVQNLQFKSTAGGFISVLRPSSDSLDSSYLYRWFSSEAVQKTVRSFANQTTNISNLDHKRVLNLEIPLPPLPEQKRIAAILDAADALRAKRRQSLDLLDQLLQSTFLHMFGDPVTNPKGWDNHSVLRDVAEVASGITKGRRLRGQATRNVPYLAVANVQDRELRLESVKTIDATEAEIERYRLQENDLLLTEGGDPDKLGRGSLWNGELEDCIHQNHVFRVRIKEEAVTPIFLSWLVGSQRGKQYFLRAAKQTTGIASINMTQLRAFPLLLPPLDLQLRFGELVAEIEKQKKVVRGQATELDTLFAALQQRAFRGDL